jgi:hypothetical protein
MTEFDQREQAFERKFELDEELEFKISAGSAHLFGLWVAEQLGLKSKETETYARKMVDTVVAKPGHEQLILKAEKDFEGKGVTLSRHRLEKEYTQCRAAAQKQIVGS